MWIEDVFHTKSPVIGLIHLKAFPGTCNCKGETSAEEIIDCAKTDYRNLTEGGIDGVLFCTEYDKPYTKCADPYVISLLTHIIDEVVDKDCTVPFGVDIQWDPKASLAIAKATGASFIRGIIVGTYCGDLGFYSVDIAELMTFRNRIHAQDVKLISNLCPEFSSSLDTRPIELRALTAFKSTLIDGICISGILAGSGVDREHLKMIKETIGDNAVFANTGVNPDTVHDICELSDGCFVATSIKRDGNSENEIDVQRVKQLMNNKMKG